MEDCPIKHFWSWLPYIHHIMHTSKPINKILGRVLFQGQKYSDILT